jgi:hypothetical protein
MSNFRILILIIKNNFFYFIYKYKVGHILKSRNRSWIFGRVACMGQDVFSLLGRSEFLYNTQKGRVDYLLNIYSNDYYKTRASKVIKFIDRNDLHSLIRQQQFFSWKQLGMPKLLYFDSYSELTDQLFINKKENWAFCSNYSDITISEQFKNDFMIEGLLPLEEIEENYKLFFKTLIKTFPDTPIVFLHFPVKLDKRPKFKERYKCILNSIEKLEGEFKNFHSIKIDEEIVDWPESKTIGIEDFPYHYNKATYLAFAKKLKELQLFD